MVMRPKAAARGLPQLGHGSLPLRLRSGPSLGGVLEPRLLRTNMHIDTDIDMCVCIYIYIYVRYVCMYIYIYMHVVDTDTDIDTQHDQNS